MIGLAGACEQQNQYIFKISKIGFLCLVGDAAVGVPGFLCYLCPVQAECLKPG
jgi:hypothetical protein